VDENCANDSDLHTKWAPLDVVELKEDYTALDRRTRPIEPPIYSEKDQKMNA